MRWAWRPFCRRHLHIHFLNVKVWIAIKILLKFVLNIIYVYAYMHHSAAISYDIFLLTHCGLVKLYEDGDLIKIDSGIGCLAQVQIRYLNWCQHIIDGVLWQSHKFVIWPPLHGLATVRRRCPGPHLNIKTMFPGLKIYIKEIRQ